MSNFKNPFVEAKRIPLPRLQGKAIERADGTWTWDLDIYVGEEYVASMCHPIDQPGFTLKVDALENLKYHAIEAGNVIAKEAYGVDEPDGYFDFKTNEYVVNK